MISVCLMKLNTDSIRKTSFLLRSKKALYNSLDFSQRELKEYFVYLENHNTIFSKHKWCVQ